MTRLNQTITTKGDKKMAAGLGFEPRHADPESAVLPLHHPAAQIIQRLLT